METWKLNFNLSKFALVHFHSSRQEIATSYTMGDIKISNPECHKDLGIIFSGHLSWTKHHQYILAKAYGKLSMVRRTFSSYCTVGTRKKLYISLIRSQLVYGYQLWRPMFIKDISSLKQLQRRATKFILQDYTSDYKSRLLSLNLLPLMMPYELNDIMFLSITLKKRSESFDILKYVALKTSNTRSGGHKLVHIRPLNNTHRNLYFLRIVRLWNALPILDLSLSVDILRNKVKKNLWSYFGPNLVSNNPCSYHFICPCNLCSSTNKTLNLIFCNLVPTNIVLNFKLLYCFVS